MKWKLWIYYYSCMSKICHATEQIWNIFIKLFTTTLNTLMMLHTIVFFISKLGLEVLGVLEIWEFPFLRKFPESSTF